MRESWSSRSITRPREAAPRTSLNFDLDRRTIRG